MRLFVAIEFLSTVTEDLAIAIEPLREEEPGLSWIPAEKQHLTIKFLGEVSEERIDEMTQTVDRVAQKHSSFDLEIAGIGAFPTFRRARVLWIGVEQAPRLEFLHHDIEVEYEKLGFELEGRPFRPHLTLARLRTPLAEDRAKRLVTLAHKLNFSASADVGNITLFESTLARSGARYRRVHVASLGGR